MKALFPLATKYYVLAFQFSSWYPLFTKHTIKSTIIRPLSSDFWEYLDADGVFVPVGSENTFVFYIKSLIGRSYTEVAFRPSGSTLSDDDDEKSDVSEDDDADLRMKQYAFPELDRRIRECIVEYDAVFPKLNFSSPKVRKFIPDSLAFIEDVYPGKDASWLLHSSTPLKCTSPADVYLLLKCSDFVNHDLLEENVFEGCDAEVDAASQEPEYELELVLRKWYPVDSGRELRCFVRDNALLGETFISCWLISIYALSGFSQRDTNYYEFWNQQETRERVVTTVKEFWEQNIRDNWTSQQDCMLSSLLPVSILRLTGEVRHIRLPPYSGLIAWPYP